MKLNRFAKIGAVAAVSALALAGCAQNEGGATNNTTAPENALSGTLTGGGASSQEVAVQTWSAGLQTANPDLTINYDPAGSGAGRDSFQAGAFAFAGSDRAFRTSEIEAGPFDACAEGSDIVQLPTYISPIAVIFNIEGIEELNLDAPTLAGIFAGTITNWTAPEIAATNPGVDLPNLAITPVHRSDNSGTTENFTDYLHQAAPDVWTHEPNGNWPLDSGEAGQGTSGVVSAVQGGQGTIGYADASRAGGFGTVAVKVGEEFVPYSPEAAAAVVDASPREEGRSATDLAVALDRTTTESGAYPIVLIAYLIGCVEYKDASTAELVKAFFSYAASAEGQDAAHEAAGSAPISDTLRSQVNTAIEAIH